MNIIDLDIGGTIKISTTKETLMKFPESSLAKFIEPFDTNNISNNTNFNLHNGRIFIDRDGPTFLNVINYLRNGTFPSFKTDKEKLLFDDELDFWQIPYKHMNKHKTSFKFDKDWCAETIRIENSQMRLYKNDNQHGIVFCKPNLDNKNNYIEFKIVISKNLTNQTKNKSHLFLGAVNKIHYRYENLLSTFWRDCPSSYYWDTWNTKLIKTDENGAQIGSTSGYGCQCINVETNLAIKYDYEEKTLSFYKNGVNLGVAFRNVPSGLTPSLDVWFEEGTIEIIKVSKPEELKFL